MKAPKAGWVKSRLKVLSQDIKNLDDDAKMEYLIEYLKKYHEHKGAITEGDSEVLNLSKATGFSPKEIRNAINTTFSPISDYSLNEFVKEAISETGDLRKHIDKMIKSSYYRNQREGLQARYIRRQGCFEFGGKVIDTSCNDICPECCGGYGIDLRY